MERLGSISESIQDWIGLIIARGVGFQSTLKKRLSRSNLPEVLGLITVLLIILGALAFSNLPPVGDSPGSQRYKANQAQGSHEKSWFDELMEKLTGS